MTPTRILTPDPTLWPTLSDLVDILGAETALALAATITALVLGAAAWGLGHAAGAHGLTQTGRWAVIGSLLAATAITTLPRLITWVMTTLT
ncbi:hypothetical protein [Actinomyces wuliandei]|uniref:hypothetical protein n=1 Tax=Actinomyces wuliandei TaxID=2057743 RepID=UPI00111B79CA|nr:hypothetical protein [Actinomyces wuliandei]